MKKIAKIYATVTYPNGAVKRLTWSRKNIGEMIHKVPALMRSDEKNLSVKFSNIGRIYSEIH